MAVERKVWRYQRGNQKPGTDNIMAKKENGKGKQWSTKNRKHRHLEI
jgi:hypothetical protein